MQLTRFDRWLREKYVYETHIHTLRPPESLPAGIQTRNIPDVPGKRYKHLFVASRSRDADRRTADVDARRHPRGCEGNERCGYERTNHVPT